MMEAFVAQLNAFVFIMGPKKRPAKAIDPPSFDEDDGEDTVMKRPCKKASSDHETESVKGTPANELVKSQIGKEDSEIDEFWNKLSKREQQSLWKKFEFQRQQDGTSKEYQDLTKGYGRNQKALSLMKVYLKLGSTKHPAWVQSMASLRTSESYKETEEWIPLEGALKKFGPTELKARVQAGTIQVRKSPTDNRFPEFLDSQQVFSKKTEVEKARTGTMDEKCKWEDFAALSKLKVTGLQSLDFLAGNDEKDDDDSGSGQEEDAVTLATGLLDPKKKKQHDVAKQALKQFETASALAEQKGTIPDKTLNDAKKKLRAHLKKVASKLPDNELKEEAQNALTTLDSLEGARLGVIKKAMNSAALVGKRALKSLTAQ